LQVVSSPTVAANFASEWRLRFCDRARFWV